MQETKITKRNTTVTGASLMPKHLEMLDSLIEEKGYMNRSDAMRRAIEYFHEKMLPDYIYKKSAKDIAAREEVKAKKEIETITDEDFATKFIDENPVVIGSSDGYQYIILHGTANMLSPVRLDTVKEYFRDYPDLIELHKTKIRSKSIASEINPYMIQYLQKNYGILQSELEALAGNNASQASNVPHETNNENQTESQPGNTEEDTAVTGNN